MKAMGVGRRRSKWIFAVSVYAALLALLVFFLFPLLWIVGLSLKTRMQVFASPPLFLWCRRYRTTRRCSALARSRAPSSTVC